LSQHLGVLADTVRFSWVDGPGNRYVLFLQGCNFNCVACHNPHTIPLATSRARLVNVVEVLADLRPLHHYLSGITVSGGEATIQHRFVHELFLAVKSDPELAHLTTFIDTNGSTPSVTWDRLLPVTDGAMVDLKALDPDLHIALTDSANDEVLDSIRQLAEAGKLYEVRLLLVPGINDTEGELRRTADWLLSVDPAMRIKVIGFRGHGVRASARHWPGATAENRDEWQSVLRDAGVRRLELV
jgi:pyruvate formate lyase activating enzyme